jgi:hypothetical protein
MLTKTFQNRGGGNSELSAYVAPEVLLHEFNVELGFADSLEGDAWTKAEEEEL